VTLEALAAYAGLIWVALAIALGLAELAAPGVFLVFLAIAAAITGVATFALPALSPLLQLASFAGWSAASIAIGRRWYLDYPVATADPLLNDRGSRLIGDIVTVVATISDGEGRVRVGDGVWTATGPDALEGTSVQIVAVRDGKLVVEQLPKTN